MTSIPAAICRNSRNNFKRHYLRKKETLSGFFISFLKCASKKKNDYPRLIISEIIDTEKRGYLNV